MKSKLNINIVLILFCGLLFSGCSFQGKSDGGVFRSSDGGKNFEQKSKIGEESSLGKANILDLEFDPNNSEILYIGTGSLGILRSTNKADDWIRGKNDFTSVEDIVINPKNSNELYVTALIGGVGKIMKTTDGGSEWEEVFTESTAGARVLSLVMDKNNSKILYAGDTLGGIYKTDDAGISWKTLLWADGPVKKIEMDNVSTSKIYFVTGKSGVLRSDDAGGNFTEIETSNTVYNLVAHPTKENIVFVSDQDGLHRSDNAGETLNQINTLVQPEKLGSRGLAINPKNDNEIYFASGRAFYKTTNGGQTWSPVPFESSKIIEIIQVDPANPEIIYIGTGDRNQGSSFSLFPTLN